MTVYPFEIDSDADLIRVDDNITEIGGEAINQLRDAVFAVEKELGIRPAGSAGSVAARLNTSLNQDGSIKTSALASVGLATLPISDSQVGTNAGIKEYKLALDHSTSDLNTLIVSNSALLNALTAFASATDSNLLTHIAGGSLLTDGSPARHVSSQIDLNAVPTDARDPLFTWGGLFNKDGVARSAANVTEALDQINTDLIGHENATDDAHVATAINLDTDNFDEIPKTIDTVQKFVDHIDDFEVITIADHRATQHANGIPKIGRVSACSQPDGYGQNVVANTPVHTFLVRSPNITPVDSISNGDDVISFHPIDNSSFLFDAQFSQVRIGDDIRVNYGSGFEASFKVESIRFTPGSEWIVRINGVNLADSSDGYASARIDRSLFDRDTSGILAVAAANATPSGSFDTILQSVIVGHPRGAVALGNGFDLGQLDEDHYKLWLELYPTGNPSDRVISLPAIDVTGNAGTTVGRYTLDSVVHETNKKLREIGYNYRFIAFADHGNFGIMLADAISCASFSITNGTISSGVVVVGSYTENVIGDIAVTGFDALGFGNTHADLASPAFGGVLTDSSIAQFPTKVIVPFKSRDYIVDGQRRDNFASTWLATADANGDGYWDGYISDRVVVGAFTVETTYTVFLDLKPAGLKPGKTLVVQPAVAFTDSSYFDVDYGRFIIKSITFPAACPGEADQTQITVINGIHAAGAGVAFSASPPQAVKLYFSEDSVSFNDDNVIDSAPSGDKYHRLHEVFVNKDGKTFSHERGRMIVQGETGTLLRTGFGLGTWHIQDISPKLRGYRDNATTFNKYLRFYILTYDVTSGEYTGYIGQRDPSSTAILKTGPITTGRKNVTTRFYDESNVDYIDLVFVDDSPTSAGVPILNIDAVARYVDIEVFDSLQLNDDLMLLATTEVNWDPVSGQEVIQRVVNRREFGSIDEEDFTESAIDFITAGDRHLHENGVLRGFDFDYVATDNREIFYKGGVALINGKVLTTNAISATIPDLYDDSGAAPPVDVDWAVCVNEEGFLEPILITASKYQFFAQDRVSASTYYVPSVTFAELVDTRKDLTPIGVVTAHIASVTIGSGDVADVRRFVADGKGRDLVYAAEGMAGTFHSADALVNWVNNYASSAPLVAKMRGEFNVTMTQDFTGLTSKLVVDGDGAVFNATADQGFLVSSNLTLRNIVFTYNPDTVAMGFTSAGDKINTRNGGCIYGSGDISDITVDGCEFSSDVTTGGGATGQRPPFIAFDINKEDVVQDVKVVNNTFTDNGGAVPGMQAAVAIVSRNDSLDTEPAIAYNVRIEDNTCNLNQGIYIMQESDDVDGGGDAVVNGPGIRAYNTIISRNSCGVIGYLTSSIDTTASIATNADRVGGIVIERNTCLMIANILNYVGGVAVGGTYAIEQDRYQSPFPAGSADVHYNRCNMIYITATDNDESEDTFTRVSIESNRLTATDPTILNFWNDGTGTGFGVGAVQNWAIYVTNGLDDVGEVIIANNTITPGLVDSTAYEFFSSVNAKVSCSITGNIIKGIGLNGFGISASNFSGFKQYIISNNQLFRDVANVTINKYILLDSNSSNAGGLVTNNYLNSPYVDIGLSDDEVISGSGTSPSSTRADTWIVERNKNQTDFINLYGSVGNVALGSQYAIPPSGVYASSIQIYPSIFTLGTDRAAQWEYKVADGDIDCQWIIDLKDILPIGVRIQEAVISADVDDVTFQSDMFLYVHREAAPIANTASAIGATRTTLSSGALDDQLTHSGDSIYLWIALTVHPSEVSNLTFNIYKTVVTYRW